MAVYVVTGKLGSGKTLACVGKIRDALFQGRPVATNLDINLEKLVGKKAKNVRLYRVPDHPTADDLIALGTGNPSYDESKNGLLVLDECGTWFNSRDWNSQGRRALIDWLLHARKWGWDFLPIIQDLGAMDKQARKSVAEHVVYCRRMDRMSIPFLDFFSKLIFDKPIPKKKWHIGVVRYGDQPHSMIVDRWWYMGTDLYPSYDTKQVFRPDYPHGLYTVLPPWYTHGRYQKPLTWGRAMRISRIYFRRYSRVGLIAMAFAVGIASAGLFKSDPAPVPETYPDQPTETASEPAHETRQYPEPETGPIYNPVAERFGGMIIQGIALNDQGRAVYVQIGNEHERWNLDTIRSAGYEVLPLNACTVQIMSDDRRHRYRVHTSYCPNLDRYKDPSDAHNEAIVPKLYLAPANPYRNAIRG